MDYKTTLSNAEKQLKEFSKLQWTPLVNHTNIYTSSDNSVFQVRKDTPDTTFLQHLYASLSTISLREHWCPLFKNITVKSHPKHNTKIIYATLNNENKEMVEQTTLSKNAIEFISASSNWSMYIQIKKQSAVLYLPACEPEIASRILDDLFAQNTAPPFIQHCDKAIQIQETSYEKQEYQLEYILKEESSGVDITRKHHRWGSSSGSWDPSHNKFLSSSSLLFSSSSSPKRTVMSSFPEQFIKEEEEQEDDVSDELRLVTKDVSNLTVSLVDLDASLSNKFAQLCVKCYKRPCGYIIQIVHPYQLMQYFKQEEAMKLDEDDQQHVIRVRLTITATSEIYTVNDNPWILEEWSTTTDQGNSSSSISSISSSHTEEEGEDNDIFVDGMENIDNNAVSVTIVEQPRIVREDVTPEEPPIVKEGSTAEKPNQVVIQPIQKPIIKDDSKDSKKIEIPIPLNTHESITIPEGDPVALQKIYPQFLTYLSSNDAIIQQPSKENGHVLIKKIDIQGHPMGGGFLSESTWKDASLWDTKAVIESSGARKIWDTTFENNTFLHALTATSSIWHTKMKGAWPVTQRDYVVFHGCYGNQTTVDVLTTSCIGDSFQYKQLPKETSGYVRATADVIGWRFQQLNNSTTLVKQILVTQFSTWSINYITSRFIVQSCAAVQFARDYFLQHGAPPLLESTSWATVVNVKHDHDRKNWRCEYTRKSEVEDVSKSTMAVIRLDKRKWAHRYSIVIDPPPSRVSAMEKAMDPYGIWVSVEHEEAFIIPLRGKILILIKPDEGEGNHDVTSCQLNVNGNLTRIEVQEKAELPLFTPIEALMPQLPAVEPVLTEQEHIQQALDTLTVTPHERAQSIFAFLKQTDEQFGWTVISDNAKTGLRTSKKSGTKDSVIVPDPFMIYKATKVIENFSVNEVAAVVTDIRNLRKAYDDTVENTVLVKQLEPGCRVLSQSIKAIFPFKNREVYAVSCLAEEKTTAVTPSTTRTFYIESSLPDFPLINKKNTRCQFYITGWILEEIDPYTTTTNHPLPSMRITHVTALDLGHGVPSYISNLLANNGVSSKIKAVESHLRSKAGPPPFISQPNPALLFANNSLSSVQEWTRLDANYDIKLHEYNVRSEISLEVKEDTEQVSPSPSTSATLAAASPFRRPSHHTIVSPEMARRGSLPLNAIPKKRSIIPIAATATEPTLSMATHKTRCITFLQSTFDLRNYPKGYEIQAQLYNSKRNISHQLTLTLAEPSLALSDQKKALKHSVVITTPSLKSGTYRFEFTLMPAKPDTLQMKRLTVSNVLEDESWHGIMLVNGVETELGEELRLSSLDDEAESITAPPTPLAKLHDTEEETSSVASTSEENDHEDDQAVMQYMGGGVVATALGNVSAGVNNFSQRMFFPFRSSSTAVVLKHENPTLLLPSTEPCPDHTDDDNQDVVPRGETTLHEIRLLRRKRDTMRKGMLLLMICLGLAVVFALLMVQPMLERYYASFKVSSTVENLEQGVKKGVIQRLIQIPWFGGWDIQVIAVKRSVN